MKKRFIALFVLAFIFSFNLSAMADEGHDDSVKQAAEKFKEGTNEQKGHSEEADTHSKEADTHSKEADTHLEEAASHSKEVEAHPEEADVHTEAEEAHEDREEAHEKEAQGDDHHGPVVETPPNYKVLGTYGAVNLSFILIGVWNKWFRRKGIK